MVLLLFMIGLELSFERLKIMSRLVFGLGALQVAICTAGLALILIAFGVAPAPALLIGVALAQSSTAVLIQVLADEKKLATPVGRASFAVLLFQDIAVAPILFGVAVITRAPLTGDLPWYAVVNAIGWLAVFVLGAAWRMSKDTARV